MILKFYKNQAFQRLNAYYGQSTVFDVLGVQRSENRHSAFLKWLLDPGASHQLNETPLRKLLALFAAKANSDQCKASQVRDYLLTGNYQLSIETITTEQPIIRLVKQNATLKGIVEESNGKFKEDGNNRFDIWIVAKISFSDDQGNQCTYCLPIVVENKIYSKEGNATDKDKAQTVRYQKAVEKLENEISNGINYQPILIYLAPPKDKSSESPISSSFVHITYQDLLDHVIQPCAVLSAASNNGCVANVLLDGYIRNLSCPSRDVDDKGNKKDYSILAISEVESQDLEVLYNEQAYQLAFNAVFPKQAGKLKVPSQVAGQPSDTQLESFWNANESLFKIVLYNHFRLNGNKNDMETVQSIIKSSCRDSYRIGIKVNNGNVNWLTQKAPNAEAACFIFKAYLMCNPSTTLDQLRNAFPCDKISEYYGYGTKHFVHLFYELPTKTDADGNLCTVYTAGKKNGQSVVASKDFQIATNRLLDVNSKKVMCVKWWRKDDFERLLKWVKKYPYIVIERAD